MTGGHERLTYDAGLKQKHFGNSSEASAEAQPAAA